MDAFELKEKLSKLSIWKKNGQRAPHKPLLILLGFAQLQQNHTTLPYELVREKLRKLLMEFGPPRRSYHPEEPFVRLTTDGIWRLSDSVDKRQFSDKQLLERHIEGGFNVRLGHQLVGVDAAHIQWHQAGGPDTEENGIALCSLHHKCLTLVKRYVRPFILPMHRKGGLSIGI